MHRKTEEPVVTDVVNTPQQSMSSERPSAPFYQLEFTRITDGGRAWIQIEQVDDEAFEVKTEQGPHTDVITNDFRVNTASVVSLRDRLAQIGVFGWDDVYGDAPLVPNLTWNLTIVFQKGVFTQSSRGGSDVPVGFDDLVDLLEQAGMPKPSRGTRPESAPSAGFSFPIDMTQLFGGGSPMGFGFPMGGAPSNGNGTAGANSSSTSGASGDIDENDIPKSPSDIKGDAASESDGTKDGANDASAQTGGSQNPYASGQGPMFGFGNMQGMPMLNDQMIHQMESAIQQLREHPEMFQNEMRREFNMLGPDQQEQMLDFLSQMGMGDRGWWENFLRG